LDATSQYRVVRSAPRTSKARNQPQHARMAVRCVNVVEVALTESNETARPSNAAGTTGARSRNAPAVAVSAWGVLASRALR